MNEQYARMYIIVNINLLDRISHINGNLKHLQFLKDRFYSAVNNLSGSFYFININEFFLLQFFKVLIIA